MESVNYWIVPGIPHRCHTDAEYVNSLLGVLCERTGVNILERTRRREVCEPRQVAAYLLLKNTDYTLHEIAEILHVDHSTVVHCRKVVNDFIDSRNRGFQKRWGELIDVYNQIKVE